MTMNQTLIRSLELVACMCLGVGLPSLASADEKTWDFPSTTHFVPCENVGVSGAFGVHVRATFTKGGSGEITLTALFVDVDSAAFDGDGGDANATLSIGNTRISLVKPWYDTIGVPGSTVHLVMPAKAAGSKDTAQASVAIGVGSKAALSTSAMLPDTGGGACALGTQDNVLDF
jgi:hypothetical protein